MGTLLAASLRGRRFFVTLVVSPESQRVYIAPSRQRSKRQRGGRYRQGTRHNDRRSDGWPFDRARVAVRFRLREKFGKGGEHMRGGLIPILVVIILVIVAILLLSRLL